MDSLRQKLNDETQVAALAKLSIDAWLAQPVATLVPVELVVAIAREGLAAWVSAPEGLAAIERTVERAVERLQAEPRALKAVVPSEAKATLRELVGRPFSPDRRLVLTVIDREPTRELVRALLLDFVLDFGRKASAPVAGMAKGLGTFAKLAGEAVKAKAGTLGSIVGAVGGEVERQMEKRAVEFVDAALSGVFGQLADAVSDPRRAAEAAELRLAMLDGVLELTPPQLARELANADVAGGAKLVREGLSRWLASPGSTQQLTELAQFFADGAAGRSLEAALAEVGLLDVVRARGVHALAARIREVVATPAFARWADGA